MTSLKTNPNKTGPTPNSDMDEFKQLIVDSVKNALKLNEYEPPQRNIQETLDFLEGVSNETLFPDGKVNTRMLRFKSIKAARYLTSFIVEDEMRKNGGVRACTHFLETGAIATNMRHKLTYFRENRFTDEQAREIIGFVSYFHDHEEDYQEKYPFLTAPFFVETCWAPYCLPENRQHGELVAHLIHDMMDPLEKMKKNDRLMLQAQRALADPTGVEGAVRLADKISKLARDIDAHEKDPKKTPLWRLRRSARKRRPFVRMLPLSKEFPLFEELIKYADALSEPVMAMKENRRKRKTLRKASSRPINPTFRRNIRNYGGSMDLAL